MTWSFSGNPSTSPKDAVRYLIGDTSFAAVNATLQAGGSNYTAGDRITLLNGVVISVLTVNSGAVATFAISDADATSQPSNPVAQAFSSGSGSGATFNITAYVGSRQEVQDEEILWSLTQRSTVYGAAADVARAIAARYTRKVDVTAGDTKKSYSQRAKQFLTLANQLDTRGMATGAMPYAGGISKTDKQQQEQNTDRVQPAFNIGMQDNELPVGPAGNETQTGTTDQGQGPD